MPQRHRVALASVLLFLFALQIQDTAKVERSRRIALEEKTVLVTVYSEDEAAAEEVLDYACEALPSLERIIGVPYPSEYGPRVVLGGDPAGRSIYAGRGTVELLMTRHWRGALTHELAHVWFDYSMLPRWIAEGASELYAYEAFLDMGFFGEALDFKSRSTSSLGTDCPPLERSKWRGEEKEAYACAFVFFLHLRDAVGDGGLKETNRLLFSGKRERRITEDEYADLLEEPSPQETHEIESLFRDSVYATTRNEPGMGAFTTLSFLATLYWERLLSSRTGIRRWKREGL